MGRRAEAVPVSEEAVRLRRELAGLNRDAYLPGYVRSVTVLGWLLIEDARPDAAISPLIEAITLGQEMPEHEQNVLSTVVNLLRQAYMARPTAVAKEFHAVTGQDVPAWMTEPPVSPE
jgi:hypothetical protein